MVATNTRQKAREALKGKWGEGVILIIAFIIINFLMGYIVSQIDNNSLMKCAAIILCGIIEIPLSLGYVYSFMKLKRHEEVRPFEFVQIAMDNFARALYIWVRVFLKMIIPIMCIIAAIALYIVMKVFFYSASASFAMIIVGIIVYVIAIAYAVIIGLLYAISYNVAYDNPKMSAIDVVNESERLMRGHRGDLFVLMLSFLGWAILALVTFGFGYLWLIPYVMVAEVCFYDEVIELDKKKKSKTKEKAETK